MGFTIRLGGWRPVQLEEGRGRLLRPGLGGAEVHYRFEVWHQMVGGFPGPFRSEGRLEADADPPPDSPGLEAELELEDGRRLELHLTGEGRFVAHGRPEERPEELPESPVEERADEPGAES